MTRTKIHTSPPDVLAVLADSTITATTLQLPDQLERKLYQATMKIIEAAGGRWSRANKCHVFDHDPRECLGLAIANGEIVDEKATYQAFFTPWPLAVEMAEQLAFGLDVHGYLTGYRILEPSAGSGVLARAARKRDAKLVCVELQPKLAAELEKEFTTIEGDFLTKQPGATLFDGVIMNPPFTRDQDAAHILHAWEFLRPGGVMVAICSPRYTFADTDLCAALHRLIVNAKEKNVRELPPGAFKSSGTDVRTMNLFLRK